LRTIQKMKLTPGIVLLGLVLIVLFIGVLTIRDYGEGWDNVWMYQYGVKSRKVYQCPADRVHNYSYTMNWASTDLGRDVIRAPSFFIHVFECHGTGSKGKCSFCESSCNPNTVDVGDGDCDSTNETQNDSQVEVGAGSSIQPTSCHRLYFPKRGDASAVARLQARNMLRHNAGWNIIFFDGHAKWFRYWDPDRMTLEPDKKF